MNHIVLEGTQPWTHLHVCVGAAPAQCRSETSVASSK